MVLIEMNTEFRQALELMEKTSKNVFITGRAGTGKSTLLEYFRGKTTKKVALLAPTGVAALNIRGQTIHSFFRFGPGITINRIEKYKGKNENLYKKLEIIIIDEISMVRADLLDCIDKFLRLNRESKKPFGGVQIVFIGDLYQLSPIVNGKERELFRNRYKSQYFFDADVFQDLEMEFIELEKIYRQKDIEFISILNAIRSNLAGEEELRELNMRVNPEFEKKTDDFYIYLTTTNMLSEEINNRELKKLKGKSFNYTGKLKGNFDKGSLPAPLDLNVKTGSQVMLLNNDSSDRWVNGSIGKITAIEEDGIIVKLSDGEEVEVDPHKWELYKMHYDKEKDSLESEVLGSFTQFPMKLAWAVTIHKAQGKTFDKVIIDIGSGTFCHGQVYVALSRCTTLEGIILKKPIEKKHIFMDWKVVKFLTKYQYGKSEKKCSLEDKIRIIKKAIRDNSKLDIVYLKASDVKSRRTIKPISVGEQEYMGRTYQGLEAFCLKRNANRMFRVDRILEISRTNQAQDVVREG